ncbi:MAG: GTPase Era [Kiritimatiellia bacterium]
MEKALQPKKCAVIGIVGRTNSGKSTLLNTLVGEKVSIVSPVVQTTRNTIRAVLTQDNTQLVFLDTPGLHKAVGNLGSLMNRMARSASAGVDILMVVFDASKKPLMEDDGWMRRALKTDQQLIFVLNKKDRSGFNTQPFHELYNNIQAENNSSVKADWIESSAVTEKGVSALRQCLLDLAPPAEDFLFPEDIITDYPRKLAVADTIREKFLGKVYNEVPHELGVFIEHIAESANCWDISAVVYVNRSSQKGFVIGPKGSTLKTVRKKAEKELSYIFDTKVKISLWVKVEKNWFKNSRLLEQMGYAGPL